MESKVFFVRTFGFCLGFIVAVFAVSGGAVHAADADFDSSWGVDGTTWTDFYDFAASKAYAVAVQPDGKIVVAGSSDNGSDHDFAVFRFSGDDTTAADPTFSGDGRAFFDFGWGDDFASEVFIQPDGKIVMVGEATGSSGSGFGVVRFTDTGSLDGSWFSDFSTTAAAHGAALQPDGKIVVVGKRSHPTSAWNFAVSRLTTGLELDTSFASGGLYTYDFGDNGYDCAYEVAIAGDGRIVAAGTGSWLGKNQFVVMWFTSAGVSAGGGVSTFTDPAYGYGLALQPDDKPVVVGKTGSIPAIARFETDGQLDTTFGLDGMASFAFSPGVGMDVGIQHDGKIVLAGYFNDGEYDNFLLMRHLQNTGLDYTFTGDFKSHIIYRMINAEHARAHAMALQPDGKILVAGYTGPSAYGSERFSVSRHLGDETLIFVDGFEWGSVAWWSLAVP